jgi:hypothetical protein
MLMQKAEKNRAPFKIRFGSFIQQFQNYYAESFIYDESLMWRYRHGFGR